MHFSINLFHFSPPVIVAAIVFLVVIAVKNRNAEKKWDDAAPVQSVWARIAAKRFVMAQNDVSAVNCITFEAPDGSVLELEVDAAVYEAFREGECGELVYQRRRFLSFTPRPLPDAVQFPQGGAAAPAAELPQQFGQNQTGQF